MSNVRAARRLAVTGVVQGVGFRPFVYRLAQREGLAGWVRNTTWGVEIVTEGAPAALERFTRALRDEHPPQARIEAVEVDDLPPDGREGFEIVASRAEPEAYQLVSPDLATCADCLRELRDPTDRRYRYPFTNCTNCGPRFTIICDVPYDRPQTTMHRFAMCPDCAREYHDPLDRRFHAQPNACPACGPQLTLQSPSGDVLAEGDAALVAAAGRLLRGEILALKGLGGYQLACDATDGDAVARLRARKRRPHKPFAVMLADRAALESHAVVSEAAWALLTSPAAPIVLLPWRRGGGLAEGVAPAQAYLGAMLPYTPLHHLLLAEVGRPLVMTSGNLSEEPIARDNDEARARLGGIADVLLAHDRDIHSRYDDSVWFVPEGGPQPVRRARGYAPFPLRLPEPVRSALACGAELKNTFCLTRGQHAFLSQHIGDMENLETLTHYEETLALYRRLFRVQPEVVAADMHPDYLASRVARELAAREGLPLVEVQHHHAHLAACLADADARGPAIGAIMDGTGLGTDGCIWGGEWLVGDARGWVRGAHLEYLPLAGGEGAIRAPRRLALGYWRALFGASPPPPTLVLAPGEAELIAGLVAGRTRAPLTSSMGRLFDAVSALLGVCDEASYEAQAAIELEMLATSAGDAAGCELLPYAIDEEPEPQRWGQASVGPQTGLVVRVGPLLAALAEGLQRGEAPATLAWRFHATMADMIVNVSRRLCAAAGLDRVALSGGCFQNQLLLALTVPRLRRDGLACFLHRQVPCNDGGLSLGQALVAHQRMEV